MQKFSSSKELSLPLGEGTNISWPMDYLKLKVYRLIYQIKGVQNKLINLYLGYRVLDLQNDGGNTPYIIFLLKKEEYKWNQYCH